ncbi:glycosyltransferase family 2 protein [Azospirillum halopraeferens]|uniref:glycosyltransferase family 2 protein n=1 Tax=Azospirillum halopraeferens TaxID=34010 RepID=UPI0004134247|nr:glycosyltransferase family 2 protein [Azospirillum halopraeferens]
MKVSIVTISFNQAEFLEHTILSVLGQDHPDIEYIVVDPGSTDGSRAIIERHRDRIARVILDPDDGPADGLARGLAAATGGIFGYLNADDRLLPGAVSRIVRGFARHPRADAVYGHGIIEDHRLGLHYRVHASRPPLKPWLLAFGGIGILQQSMFFRTGAVRAVGGFNPANRTCWDGELLAELVLAGAQFHRIDALLSVFTLHERSISGSGRLEDQYRKDADRIFARLMGRGPAPGDGLRRAAARLLKWARDPVATAWRLRRLIDRRPQPLPTVAQER